MTRLSTRLRQLFSSPTVVYECHNCGTTLDDEQTECPDCGSIDTACYDLE